MAGPEWPSKVQREEANKNRTTIEPRFVRAAEKLGNAVLEAGPLSFLLLLD